MINKHYNKQNMLKLYFSILTGVEPTCYKIDKDCANDRTKTKLDLVFNRVKYMSILSEYRTT